MFLGFEYLYFDNDKDSAYGFEAMLQRDYELRFGTLDYKNTVGSFHQHFEKKIDTFRCKI